MMLSANHAQQRLCSADEGYARQMNVTHGVARVSESLFEMLTQKSDLGAN